MSNFTYHSVQPENLKDDYVEYDNVDFVLSFPQHKLNLGSLRLEGRWKVQYSGADLQANETNKAKEIYFDHFVGAHATIESITTQVQGATIENYTDYGRWVKMSTTATADQGDMMNSENVCEMKAPFKLMTNNLLKGEITETEQTGVRNYTDFSIKLNNCLNSTQDQLPYTRSGDIRVSINLARTGAIFHGKDVDNNLTWSLQELRLAFTSVMDDGMSTEAIPMRRKLSIKQSLQSSFANVSVRVPAVCSAVSCSLLAQGKENSLRDNTQALEKINGLTQLQFMFNDSTNSYVSYLIKNNSEVIDRYIDSLLDTGNNALSIANMQSNNGYGVGLNFDDMVDLSNQKFNLQVSSAITSATPMILYMYFHSVVSL
ncbi:MAG: hypothetical protein HKN86_05290 [Acidimicrobiia bacterium]|nr:hypothetical protein [Acidimicrobiia bacterium]